jgi:flagellar basal-body rod protein FlgF
MDVVANNLANLSTPAFKGEEMLFSQYLVQPRGTPPLAFVEDVGTARDMRRGPLTKTGNPLDIALDGNGYLAVQTPLGTRYTRNGHCQLDAQGQIVTSQGYPVLSDGGAAIPLPANVKDIAIGPDGTISVSQDGTASSSPIGKLQIVNFAQPQLLTPAANGLYLADQPPEPAGSSTTVQQGMIEDSNVQPVIELTRLMAIARASGSIKDFLDEESTRQRDAIDKLAKAS